MNAFIQIKFMDGAIFLLVVLKSIQINFDFPQFHININEDSLNKKRKKNLIFDKKKVSKYLNKWTKNISCFVKKNEACEGG